MSYRTRHVKSPARRGRVIHHEISSHPAVLFSQQHQHVTKDGDLLSAHGYTHFSASCYLVRNANCTNKLTVRLGTFIFFPSGSTSDTASAVVMQITLKTLQQQTIQIEIDPEQTVSGSELA